MRLCLLGYCLGVGLISFFPALDRDLLLASIALLSCFLLAAVGNKRRWLSILCLGCLIGVAWHWTWAVGRMQARLPAEFEGKDVVIEGLVASIPQKTAQGQRFLFAIKESDITDLAGKLQLSSYVAEGGPEFVAGERWRLLVRLKQPHGYMNPGLADQEARQFSNGIAATGYVRSCSCNQRIGIEAFSLPGIRARVYRSLDYAFSQTFSQLPSQISIEPTTRAMMLALILGEKSELDTDDWQRFARTGTSHLFVISGLHIGLVSLMCFRLVDLLSRFGLSQLLRTPSPIVASVASIVSASLYSALAGWTLPTQRAFVMCAAALIIFTFRRRINISLAFLIALSVVLTLDPLAHKSSGFWLSFIAVAALVLFAVPSIDRNGQLFRPSLTSRFWLFHLRPQMVIWVALFVPLVIWMGQVSLIAPLVNLVAIPLVGLVVVPLLLIGSLMLSLGFQVAELPFLGAAYLLENIHLALVVIENGRPFVSPWLSVDLEWQQLTFLTVAAILILFPRGVPFRWLAVPFVVPLAMAENHPIAQGEFEAHVIDVGQGLSVLIQTHDHTLLFDAGPGNGNEWNAGSAIIEPVLREMGINQIDRLVVSHGDNDHAGGVQYLLRSFPVGLVLTGESLAEVDSVGCRADTSWYWNEVRFEFLHPRSLHNEPNNNSCVLIIRSAYGAVLLPGDIDKSIERQLVLQYGQQLHSDVLVAAHHGSKTSSSFAFLKAVDAPYVVFAAGYLMDLVIRQMK